jgi:predicted AAA+ superfamily ATPase
MFKRLLEKEILSSAETFYAVGVVGPRQSGKTTLLKLLFPSYIYLNLEDPDTLSKIKLDPRGFLNQKNQKYIIDEAQEYPELFSFLLGIIDENKVKGQFILSGSQNFTLLDKISQSLAGRIAILELLPLTYDELASFGVYTESSIWDLIYQGSYPGPYHDGARTDLWFKSYITTYLQRDVRQVLNIKDLSKFHLFLKLCAGRHGQLLNLSELGSDCGISHTTVGQWISLLEASYILFRLQPYYKNFSKRVVKTPKLYFYDSGIVSHLLGIESGEHAKIHASRGALFEGYVISEIAKQAFSRAQTPSLYFWNSHKDFEIDLLIEKGGTLSAVEIKSSSTFTEDFLSQLKKWKHLTSSEGSSDGIVYAGEKTFSIKEYKVVSYKNLKLFY